ncbi:MAG: SDR family NAD(P)-dependent oxidoreductase [Bacteroidota bacterium]|nr:SDR family NAD(P)-dependent oxidoreductase [Bacteroidota bacterium]
MTDQKNNQYNSPLQATVKGITDLFKKNPRIGKLSEADRLEGKKVLITGASSGLGFATAGQLAKLGATVIMACRSGIPEKGSKIRKQSGNEKVFMHQVDLSEISSIRALVAEIKKSYGKIDILICNAAVVPKQSRKTKNGLEEMFMVNYLAKFILVNSLLENACLSADNQMISRIIFVASESHRNPKEYNWEEFGVYKTYGMKKTVELYGYYKLLMVTFANELSRRLNPDGKTQYSIFALCPGPVNSNIAREAPWIFQPLLKLTFSIFFRSPGKAAEPVVYLATSTDVEKKAIDYLFLMSRKTMDEKACDPLNGKKIWELSETLLGDLDSRI